MNTTMSASGWQHALSPLAGAAASGATPSHTQLHASGNGLVSQPAASVPITSTNRWSFGSPMAPSATVTVRPENPSFRLAASNPTSILATAEAAPHSMKPRYLPVAKMTPTALSGFAAPTTGNAVSGAGGTADHVSPSMPEGGASSLTPSSSAGVHTSVSPPIFLQNIPLGGISAQSGATSARIFGSPLPNHADLPQSVPATVREGNMPTKFDVAGPRLAALLSPTIAAPTTVLNAITSPTKASPMLPPVWTTVASNSLEKPSIEPHLMTSLRQLAVAPAIVASSEVPFGSIQHSISPSPAASVPAATLGSIAGAPMRTSAALPAGLNMAMQQPQFSPVPMHESVYATRSLGTLLANISAAPAETTAVASLKEGQDLLQIAAKPILGAVSSQQQVPGGGPVSLAPTSLEKQGLISPSANTNLKGNPLAAYASQHPEVLRSQQPPADVNQLGGCRTPSSPTITFQPTAVPFHGLPYIGLGDFNHHSAKFGISSASSASYSYAGLQNSKHTFNQLPPGQEPAQAVSAGSIVARPLVTGVRRAFSRDNILLSGSVNTSRPQSSVILPAAPLMKPVSVLDKSHGNVAEFSAAYGATDNMLTLGNIRAAALGQEHSAVTHNPPQQTQLTFWGSLGALADENKITKIDRGELLRKALEEDERSERCRLENPSMRDGGEGTPRGGNFGLVTAGKPVSTVDNLGLTGQGIAVAMEPRHVPQASGTSAASPTPVEIEAEAQALLQTVPVVENEVPHAGNVFEQRSRLTSSSGSGTNVSDEEVVPILKVKNGERVVHDTLESAPQHDKLEAASPGQGTEPMLLSEGFQDEQLATSAIQQGPVELQILAEDNSHILPVTIREPLTQDEIRMLDVPPATMAASPAESAVRPGTADMASLEHVALMGATRHVDLPPPSDRATRGSISELGESTVAAGTAHGGEDGATANGGENTDGDSMDEGGVPDLLRPLACRQSDEGEVGVHNSRISQNSTGSASPLGSNTIPDNSRGVAVLKTFLADIKVLQVFRSQFEQTLNTALKRQRQRLLKIDHTNDYPARRKELNRTADLLALKLQLEERDVTGLIEPQNSSTNHHVAGLLREVAQMFLLPVPAGEELPKFMSLDAEALSWTLLVEALRTGRLDDAPTRSTSLAD